MIRRLEQFLAAAMLLNALTSARADAGVPAFRIVAPNGQTNVVIGTLHVAYAALRQPAPGLFNGARVFAVEHSTANDPIDWTPAPEVLVAQAAGRDRRAEWARTVTPTQVDTVLRNFECSLPAALTEEKLERVLSLRSPRTWAALAFVPCAPPGLASRDALLETMAKAQGIPFLELETIPQINVRRNAIPERLYIETFEYAAKLDLTRFYDDLVGAFNRGDFDHITRLIDDSFKRPADARLYKRILIDERNVAWLPALKRAFDAGHAVVGVGAAHLPGPHGLLALLAKDGYTVTPINLPPSPLDVQPVKASTMKKTIDEQ